MRKAFWIVLAAIALLTFSVTLANAGQEEDDCADFMQVQSQPSWNTRIGTSGSDSYSGVASTAYYMKAGADGVEAGIFSDCVFGQGGGDKFLHGNAGNDLVSGGDGDDEVFGEAGQDVVQGNDGDDVVRGAGDNDFLYDGPGHDDIQGGSGYDRWYQCADGTSDENSGIEEVIPLPGCNP